ncbi:non-homologous end-joining DNA ligase [Streptomyces sp. NRRL F-5126]|uniref:non-homologous end-joining DNA ligase n=1 Tax=Streptomyces sp. NRRL F-5126 TaxID=1463857 RepID=UPI0004C78746|nr:non-homologous end-joining DNA ligase [Streptomyces sp. NRRL F-5126]
MSELLASLTDDERRLLSDAPSGAELAAQPMLATLSDRRDFHAGGWIFERKLDGVRVLAVRDMRGVRLLSRTGQRQNATYPEIVDALQEQGSTDFVLDGEVVAYSHGRTDFSRLQQRLGITDERRARASKVAVTYYVFDILRLDGADLARLPLRARKALLRRALSYRPPVRFTPHRNDGGQELLDQACARGWEGLIAKRAAGGYQPRRSGDWLKLKCQRGQEFVVGGFTEPAGSRTGFGALLLGYYEGAQLRYAGKVGTGYDRATLHDIRSRLDELATTTRPFDDQVREHTARWARPELVAEVGFSEWTRDGMLRHPRFLGLRRDKRPREVVREKPVAG